MKEHIDHNNYEAWLLDRMEGNLTPEQERLLDAFLAANPGLDDGYGEMPTLKELDVTLPRADKEALKRSLPPTGMPSELIDDFLIAGVEGDLTTEQFLALKAYLVEHPEHMRSERLYALAKLVPEAIAYGEKKALERHLPPIGLPDQYNVDDFLVARFEGDLAPAQEEALTIYLAAQPHAARAWSLVQATRVDADVVLYPDKAELKKGAKVIAIGAARASWTVELRVAAMVALLLGLAFWVLDRGPGTEVPIAEVIEPPTTNTVPEADVVDPVVKETNATPQRTNSDAAPFKEVERLATTKNNSIGADPGWEHAPVEHVAENGDPVPAVDRSLELELLANRTVQPTVDGPQRIPLDANLHLEDPMLVDAQEEMQLAESGAQGIPLGGFLAGALRKRVFENDGADTRPLDREDAVTAMDRGLKVVAGDQAGLQVQREQDGRLRGFDIRFGRNLSITAGR